MNKIIQIDNFLSKDICLKLILKFKEEYNEKYQKYCDRFLLNLLEHRNDELFNEIIKKYESEKIKNIEIVFWTVGEFHDWHDDSKYYNTTIITYLNDDYEGGRTIIDKVEIEPKIGKYVKFDSKINHMVTKLTKGERFVLICWY
jgi:hypothetical protein